VSKKTEKLIKPRKLEKKITEKTEPKKKPIKILKNPVGSVRFYKQKTEKTEPNRIRKNREKTEPKPEKPSQNRFEPVFSLKKPNRTELKPVGLTQFRFFFKKISVWLLFLIKTEPNRK
jgi:hypothetical protein